MRAYAKPLLVGLAVTLIVMVGCGGGSPEDKPIDQLKADVAKMTAVDLSKWADQLKDKIADKTTEMSDLQQQVSEATGEKVDELKAKVEDVKEKLADLKERLQVVTTELAKKKAAGVTLPLGED